ncbi:hypothetical protein E2E04_25170 [Escherichia coli]|nr:hypothetical protein [Escherichia coli]
MLWNEERQRYEFTPAHDVDGPLITWTPENPEQDGEPENILKIVKEWRRSQGLPLFKDSK